MKTVSPALMKKIVNTGERALTPENLQELHKLADGDPDKLLACVFTLGYIYAAGSESEGGV